MSFFGALLGTDAADAANAAAADTYKKQQRAIGDLTNYGNQYAQQFSGLAQGYQPYVGAGNGAINQLYAGLGLGGSDAQQNFINAYRAMPGYQAGLDRGSAAVSGNAAARGMLKSGSTLKGLERFGSNYEDQRSGDYLSKLYALANTGQSALGAQNATIGQGLQGQLGTRQSAYGGAMNAAQTIGQGQIAGANAQAAGAQNIFNTVTGLAGAALGGGIPKFGGSAYSGVYGPGAASGGNNGGAVWGW